MHTLPFKHDVYPALDGYNYLEELKLYYAYFGLIPSLKRMDGIRQQEASAWLEQNITFLQKHYSSIIRPSRLDSFLGRVDVVYYVLDQQRIVKFEECVLSVCFQPGDETAVDEIIEQCRQFKVESVENEIHLVVVSDNRLETQRVKFKKPDLILDKHYNDDLLPVHEKLLKTLNEEEKSGLILFHGIPGTGKSTYLRSLICSLNKNVIFMTPELAGSLGSPELSKFLIQKSDCVFVIEDAEELLVSRESGRNSSISTILNLTDGILGESLGIQIIATFNTDLYNIDKALLRKGRMLGLYEFKALEARKSAQLMRELGHEGVHVDKPMTLADIYHYSHEDVEVLRPRAGIGFKLS